MKIKEVQSHVITEMAKTDAGESMAIFIRDCLDGKYNDLYKGNKSDSAHLQSIFENHMNALGQVAFDAGFRAGKELTK